MRTFPARAPRTLGDPRPLRIGIVAPPVLPLPPPMYAGTERIVTSLALGLHERGHHVTVFAPGDSDLPCDVVPVVPRSLWSEGFTGDLSLYHQMAVARAWEHAERFDVVHSHLDTHSFHFARHAPVPVVTTLHRRLDVGGAADYIDLFPSIPLVAISDSQRRWNPDANWVATIHHGLDFSTTPSGSRAGDYLLLVGRISREKGVAEAIELATRTRRRLVIAAKAHQPDEKALFESVVQPAIDAGVVDWRGEVDGATRDQLMVGALATVMLGAWPEPFGLVAIESMATGTPVIGRRAGALTETIDHGVTGFLVDDLDEAALAVARVGDLSRERIASMTRERFNVERMVDAYEAVYRALVSPKGVTDERDDTRRDAAGQRLRDADSLVATVG
ncbi:MAG TPA: glycosyltransferase family 4 protein [Candidatus Limnocylindrales bacterium]|nr:glycosyltransferase family 4 protein [Candidatus Limnocylindrales bacterium]